MSPGQWKDPDDRSTTKTRLDYWINLAKLLEKGDINALFLADTYGGYDTYEGKLDDCIRRAAQWPMTDPTIPISAMAAVTKKLCFGITASTSFEPPFLLAKRFATLDHMTNGRIGWNIVTGKSMCCRNFASTGPSHAASCRLQKGRVSGNRHRDAHRT